MVNGQREGDMSHMARTVGIIESAGPAQVLLPARTQSRVVQSTQVGMEEAVKRVRVGYGLPTDAQNLVTGVDQKLDGREAH